MMSSFHSETAQIKFDLSFLIRAPLIELKVLNILHFLILNN